MDCRIFELPPIGTNAYLMLSPERGEAVLFDAPMKAWDRIKPALGQADYEISGLYLTHGHWDHIIDLALFSEHGVSVFGHEDDLELIASPSKMAEYFVPDLTIAPGKIDHFLEDGQNLEILGEPVEVRHVPGHSPGSVLFYFKNLKTAITGDAIFAGSIGRTDFPGCSREILTRSILEKIYTLPDETILCPGHGIQTSVREERKTNPFVRG